MPSARHARRARAPRRATLIAIVLALLWLVIGGVGGPKVGQLSGVQQNDNASFLPASSESTVAAEQAKALQPQDSLPFLIVVTRESGLTPADRSAVQRYLATATRGDLAPGLTPGNHPTDFCRMALDAPETRCYIAPRVPA